jgi:urease accessory protein
VTHDARRRRLSVAIPAAVALLLARPQSAGAHLVTTGLGPLYDGVVHLVISPQHVLPIMMIAILASLHGPASGRRVLFVLPTSWLLAGLAASHGYVADATAMATWFNIASLLLLGILVAIGRCLPIRLTTGLALLMGVAHGWADAKAGMPERTALLGAVVTSFVLVALTAGSAVTVRSGWGRVLLRVSGSWTAAVGLLWLGWVLHGAAS